MSFCKTGCSMLNGALIKSDALRFWADVGVIRSMSAGSILSMNESDGEKAQCIIFKVSFSEMLYSCSISLGDLMDKGLMTWAFAVSEPFHMHVSVILAQFCGESSSQE